VNAAVRPTLHLTVPRRAWAVGGVLFLVLTVVLPLVLAGLDPTDLGELPTLLALGITWYSAVRLTQIYVQGSPRIVELGFFVFVYLWMGLAPLAQVGVNRFPLAQSFPVSTQTAALVTTIIGLTGYELGRGIVRSRLGRLRLPDRLERAQVSGPRTWILAGVGLVATAVITMTSGGLAVRFSSRFEAERSLFGDLSAGLRVDQAPDKALALIKGAFLSLPVFFALLLLLYLRRCARERGAIDRFATGPLATLLILLLAVANIVANNPIANSRLRVGVVAFAVLAVMVPPDTPYRFRAAVLGVLFIFLLLFPYADLFRYRTVLIEDEPLSEQLIDSPDYGMFNQDMNTIVFVNEEGFQKGRQVLGSAASLVPRRFWSGKPIATGDLVSRSEVINASSTLWSEAYVDFGRLGVFVVFTGWGVLSRVLSDAYVRRRRGVPELAGVVVPVFAGFQIFIVRGALQPTMADLWPLLFMTVFCIPFFWRPADLVPSEEPVPEADHADRNRS
jgi:hypothetical protein